ncbi:MAG: hypothetical protein KF870_04235, partial [Leadbetterella sp.]|nr:hypothetical protein [Leadbetterella sp.]
VVDYETILSFFNGYINDFRDIINIIANNPTSLNALDQLGNQALELKSEVDLMEGFNASTKSQIVEKIDELEVLRIQLKANPNARVNQTVQDDPPGGLKQLILQKLGELEVLLKGGPTVWCRETGRFKETVGDLPSKMPDSITDGIYAHRTIQSMYKAIYGSSMKAEYILKDAGPNGGPGYVDIADEENKEMYEIKSKNHKAGGLTELNNYINKANDPITGCSIKGWHAGTKALPEMPSWMVCPWNKGKEIKIDQVDAGVILYDIRNRNIPAVEPAPEFVPVAVLKKIIDDIIKGLRPSMTLEEVKLVVNRVINSSLPNCAERKAFAQMAMAAGAIGLVGNAYVSWQSGGRQLLPKQKYI